MHWVNNLPGTLQQVCDTSDCLWIGLNLVMTDVHTLIILLWKL